MAKAPSEEEARMLMAIYAGQKMPALPGIVEQLQARGLVEAGPRGFLLTKDGDKAARLATVAAAHAEGTAALESATVHPDTSTVNVQPR